MKMYQEVLEKTKKYEEKNGIYYYKTSGKLFKWLTACSLVPLVYLLAMNIFYLFSVGVFLYFEGRTPKAISSLSVVAVCTMLLVIATVFMLRKRKILGIAAQLVALPCLLVTFGYYLKEPVVFSFKASFYWRHFAPIVVLFILLCVMLIIAVREKINLRKNYLRIYQNMYELYSAQNPDTVSEEGWEEYLRNINKERNK